MTPKPRAHWKRLRPSSLRQALELCKDHALAVRHLSVERIAERMGLPDHWALYKWLQSGRMPACLVRAYEEVCGIDYVTQWLAASANKLLVDMPTGRRPGSEDMVGLNSGFAQALQLLTDFYANPAGNATQAVIDALSQHIEQVAYHRANVAGFDQPELEF